MRVDRWVFNLLFGEVARVKGIERLAVIAHALGSMATHAVAGTGNLAILAIEAIVKCRLPYYLPGF